MIAKIIRPDSTLEQFIDCDELNKSVTPDGVLNLHFSSYGKFINELHIEYSCKIYLMDKGKTIDTIHYEPKG